MGTSSPLTGADAIAGALIDSGVHTVTHVPGFGGTAVFAALQRLAPGRWPLSLHEEPAYAVAQATAFRGRRAATLLKAHGVAKAANAVLASLSSGTHAGFVVLVFDDPQGAHSDNILDTARLLDGLELPWSRHGAEDAVEATRQAFARSERLGLPVALLFDAAVGDLPTKEGAAAGPLPSPPSTRRDPARHIVCPLFTQHQRAVLQAKLGAREHESIPRPQLPRIPDGLPAPWRPAIDTYVPFFEAFRALPRAFTAGDTGLSSLFAFPPFDCVDLVCYFGGSVPLAVGAGLVDEGPVWAVTGDFAFAAAGHLGLHEAALRGAAPKVAVMENRRSAATGGQPLPEGALDRALAPFTRHTRLVRADGPPSELEAVLREANTAREPRIVRYVARDLSA